MEATNPQPLTEEALRETEARLKQWERGEISTMTFPVSWKDADTLCQTVRALRGQYESAISDFAVEINALREQLAQETQRRIDAEKAAEKWYHERY